MDSDRFPTARNTGWPRRLLRVLVVFVQLGIGVLGAVLVFNLLVMPLFVRHGNEIVVPELEGRSLDDVHVLLAEQGLAVRDTLVRTSPDILAGIVIEQLPRAGMSVKPERGVTLMVSSGRSRTRVPYLSGQTLRFARLVLAQEGYVLGDVIRLASEEVPRNTVVTSDPPRGTAHPGGQPVHLLVSDGAPQERWIMPDLRGKELLITADRLRFAGFPVNIREDEDSFGLGVIRNTFPLPGSRVAAGDTIRLLGD